MKKKVLASAMSLLLAGTMLFTGIPAGAAEDTGTAALEALLESNSELKEIVFDYEYYREMYPDLAAVFGDDEEAYYRHFLEHGLKEGRTASASFSVTDYKERYGDLQSILEDDMAAYVVHYLQHGRAENRVAVSTGVKAAPAVIAAAAPAAPAAPAPVAPAAAPAQQTAPAPAASEAEKTEPAPVPAQPASETKPAQAAEPDSDPVEEPTAEPVKTAEPVAETAPAPAETSAPAAEPTQKPAEAAPTEEPVVEPEKTAAPTAEPAQAPVEDEEELVAEPTQKPAETAVPTAEPTPAPVEDKEESGAPAETAAPTEEPAAEPKETAAPTVEPAIEPEETAAPAVEPTAEPAETTAPTAEPVAEPAETAAPTVEPTAEPAETAAPTVEPTETPAPTVEPVQEPEAHEHTYGPWKVEEKPTCMTEGTKTRTCSTCGKVETETIPVSTADIDHQLVLEETIQPVTCESWGFVTKKCALCGKEFENIAIKPLGHDWDDSYTVDKDATCTEDGSESIHCKREGCNGKKDVQVIPAPETGHIWIEGPTENATCTEDGYTSKICITCGEEERTPISALGHDYEYKSCEARTCTTPRKEIWECSRCGEEDIRFMNDPTFGTHTDIKYIEDVPPTCTKSGSGHWECLACGTVSETYTLEPLGHQWGEDKTVEYDKCSGLKITYRPCTRAKCYEAYDVVVLEPGKGHHWDEQNKCTNEGCNRRKPGTDERIVWGVTYVTDLKMCEGFVNDWGEKVGFLWKPCMGDGTIQVEAPAAKEGYEFKGWRRYDKEDAELDPSQTHVDNWENMDTTWVAVYEPSVQ